MNKRIKNIMRVCDMISATENAGPKEIPMRNVRANNTQKWIKLEAMNQIMRNEIMINQDTHFLSLAPMNSEFIEVFSLSVSNIPLREPSPDKSHNCLAFDLLYP